MNIWTTIFPLNRGGILLFFGGNLQNQSQFHLQPHGPSRNTNRILQWLVDPTLEHEFLSRTSFMAVTVEDEEGHVVGFAVLDVRTPNFGRSEKGAHVILRKFVWAKVLVWMWRVWSFHPPGYIHTWCIFKGQIHTATNPFAHQNLCPSQFTCKFPYLMFLRNSSCTKTWVEHIVVSMFGLCSIHLKGPPF